MQREHEIGNSPSLMFVLVVLAFMVLWAWGFLDTPSEAEIDADTYPTYCEMVRLHKADPTIGWPDYKHIYDKECDE